MPVFRNRDSDRGSISLDEALDATRTGDVWLFRGRSGPDRAIQTLTNSPVNHVAMTVSIDDLPPLLWHAEMGDKLLDVWTGSHHRGVQLHDGREAVLQWMDRYGQDCWLRQLTPDISSEQEDALLRVIAHLDGTPFPASAKLAGRWFRGRVPNGVDVVRGIPPLEKLARRRREHRHAEEATLAAAYCAEVVAITYAEIGLVTADKDSNWFDPGRFWSGDTLPLAPGFSLGPEITVRR